MNVERQTEDKSDDKSSTNVNGDSVSSLSTNCHNASLEPHETKGETGNVGLDSMSESCPHRTLTPPARRSSGVRVRRGQQRVWLYSSKNPKQGDWLTENDLSCLKWIGEQGTVTLEQLGRGLGTKWLERGWRYFYRRAEFWKHQRLVRIIRAEKGRQLYFSLSERGRRQVSDATGCVVPPPPSPAELIHTLRLTEFRIAAERADRVKEWVSDRFVPLLPDFPKNRLAEFHPDALWVTKAGTRILIEYERTWKTLKRRTEKARAFAREMAMTDRFMDRVVWVAEPAALKMVTEICASFTNQFVFGVESFLQELSCPLDSTETSSV